MALWQTQINDKLEGNNIYVKGCYSISARDSYLELDLLPEGQYFLYSQIDWAAYAKYNEEIQTYNINSYAPIKINFIDISNKFSQTEILRAASKANY